MMNSWQTGFLRTAAYFLIAAISGMLGVVLLGHIAGDIIPRHTLIPFVSKGIWDANPFYTIVWLVIVGLVLGYYRPERWFLGGIATVSLFPVFTLVEITLSPTSHNLWPFEFLVDAVLALPAIFAALIGREIRVRKSMK